jgi:hypothetical protein
VDTINLASKKMLTIYIKLGIEIFLINKLRTTKFIKQLNKQSKIHHFSFTKDQIIRIRQYTIQSSLTNSWFSSLTGYKIGKNEIQKGLYIGALTPVVDDLTDDFGLNYAEIIKRLKTQDDSTSGHVRLADYLYKKVSENAETVFLKYFKKAMEAQDASLKQFQKNRLSYEELYKITFDKGGYFTLLYRSVLKKDLIKDEEEAIYLLGGILQLTNDMFDLYKDYKNGQQTLFTNTNDIEKLRDLYLQSIDEMIAKFLELDYPSPQKKEALLKIFTVLSRGSICIDQLLNCQKKTGNVFKPEKYTRADLICDMEKVSNIIRSIKIGNSLKRKLIAANSALLKADRSCYKTFSKLK